MRSCVRTSHSVGGSSRPSNSFNELRWSISKGGIGIMTTLTEISGKTRGSAFLFEDVLPAQVFTPEDLTEEHLAIGRMIDEFWTNEVEPNLAAIRERQPGAALQGLGKPADLGFTGMPIPEEFGGLE